MKCITNKGDAVVATSVRTLLKFLVGLFAALQAATTLSRAEHSRPGVAPGSEASTISAFMAQLRQNAELRARFSRNPRAVLSQNGIDPAPYNLPERMNEADLQRLLSDRTRRLAEGTPNPPAPETGQPQAPPAPVYGPPPGPRPQSRDGASPKNPSTTPPPPSVPSPRDVVPPAPPSPSAPVYGPPPGLPRQP